MEVPSVDLLNMSRDEHVQELSSKTVSGTWTTPSLQTMSDSTNLAVLPEIILPVVMESGIGHNCRLQFGDEMLVEHMC